MCPHQQATRPHLGATRPRVGICLSRLDALTSKYNTFSYFLIAKLGYRTQLGNADARTRRPQVRIRPPSGDASPAYLYIYAWNKRTYIYTREINTFMFFNTKRKKIVLIICSFKAENVLLPCYSFPAKKSLKKVSFFKSLVYNVLRV